MIIMYRGRVNNKKKLEMLESDMTNEQEEDTEGTWEEENEVIAIKREKQIGIEYRVNNIEITENGKSIKIACNIINLSRQETDEASIKIIFKNMNGEELNVSNLKIARMSSNENRFINIVIPTFERVKEITDIEFEKLQEEK